MRREEQKVPQRGQAVSASRYTTDLTKTTFRRAIYAWDQHLRSNQRCCHSNDDVTHGATGDSLFRGCNSYKKQGVHYYI